MTYLDDVLPIFWTGSQAVLIRADRHINDGATPLCGTEAELKEFSIAPSMCMINCDMINIH